MTVKKVFLEQLMIIMKELLDFQMAHLMLGVKFFFTKKVT